MRHAKTILATVLAAVLLLGGLSAALAAAPTFSSNEKILTDLNAFDLNSLLDGGETVTWAAQSSDYGDYLTFSGSTVTAKKNSGTKAFRFVATNTGDGSNDTATVDVKVNIPVSVAFVPGSVTKVKGSTLDMPTQLATSTSPGAAYLKWSVVSGNGSIHADSGLLSITGAGDIRVRATSTIDSSRYADTVVKGVVPSISLSATKTTITTINATSTLTATLTGNGSTTVIDGTNVIWSSDNPTVVSVNTSPTSFTGGRAETVVTALKNGRATITAKCEADESVKATITIGVGSATHLDLTGPNLSKGDRYGTYTVKLVDAAGNTVDNDTATVHWDWSSSYLTLANDSINDDRDDMHNGEAHIRLYAKANTKSSGTRLYVWLDNDTDDKIYHTIAITGLSSLPATGQDMTLVYVLGSLGAAILIAAGVWYGIRKKRSAA